MIGFKDEYIRDYTFEPEMILGRKDSLRVQKDRYHKRKITKKPKRRKLLKLSFTGSSSAKKSNNNVEDGMPVDDDEIEHTDIDNGIEEIYCVSQLETWFVGGFCAKNTIMTACRCLVFVG